MACVYDADIADAVLIVAATDVDHVIHEGNSSLRRYARIICFRTPKWKLIFISECAIGLGSIADMEDDDSNR